MTCSAAAHVLCRPTLAAGEIHVWVVDTTQAPRDEADSELLDVSERARLSRLKSELDRSRFLRRRLARREILAAYTGVAPGELAFVTNRWGRPAFDPSSSAIGLDFNASHSGAIAVIAVAAHGRMGVDIERLRIVEEAEDIAARFFAPAEARVLSALPPAQRIEGFFNAWTRKEAVVKAVGAGLSIPLDSFEVSMRPGEPACIRRWEVPIAGTRGSEWQIRAFEPAPGYVGAIACDHGTEALLVRNWPTNGRQALPTRSVTV